MHYRKVLEIPYDFLQVFLDRTAGGVLYSHLISNKNKLSKEEAMSSVPEEAMSLVPVHEQELMEVEGGWSFPNDDFASLHDDANTYKETYHDTRRRSAGGGRAPGTARISSHP